MERDREVDPWSSSGLHTCVFHAYTPHTFKHTSHREVTDGLCRELTKTRGLPKKGRGHHGAEGSQPTANRDATEGRTGAPGNKDGLGSLRQICPRTRKTKV